MDEPGATTLAGAGIVRASFAGTAALLLACAVGVADPDSFGVVTAGVGIALFALGSGLFLWAYAIAVNRSRTDAIGIGGLYFLAGSAPRPIRLRLLGSFVAQVVVAVVAASIRPYTNLAFAVLAPVYGLALCGLWAARYGTFEARRPSTRRAGRSADGGRAAAGAREGARGGSAGGPAARGRSGPQRAAGSAKAPPRRAAGGRRGTGGASSRSSTGRRQGDPPPGSGGQSGFRPDGGGGGQSGSRPDGGGGGGQSGSGPDGGG